MHRCRVPTNRADEILRDAETSRCDSIPHRVARYVVALVLAGVTAVVLTTLTDELLLIFIVTLLAPIVTLVVLWAVPVARALRTPDHRRHWRSQVFQGAPDTVEFDLWSECDHEVAEIRLEVIEPDGAVTHSEWTIKPKAGRVASGGSIGNGIYPQRFVNARPIVDGSPYCIVWYGRRLPASPWRVIARQEFSTPIPGGRLPQTRN
ncbi:MAG: hypothetical protein AAB131_10060 [Actinomycetota bacterium]|nr:MAG: hypothetical protein FD127_2646 [Acidimicrobiaceae bacterium]